MTHVGTKLPLRSSQYYRIEAVVVDAFAHGRPYTQRALARAMAGTFDLDEDAIAERLVYYLRQLAARGMYEAQAGRFGSKGTQAKGSPTSPRWFNWSGVPVEEATLRNALEPYLADAEVPSWRKETIRKALRFHASLAAQCDDRVLSEAAGRVPAPKLYELPGAVYAEAAERFKPQTAKNYRGAVTDVLLYAGRRRLIPLVFPYFFEPDGWAEFTDRYFPLAEEGESSPYVKRHRNGMSYVRRASLELYGEEASPAQLARAQVQDLVEHLAVKCGDLDAATKAMGTLRELARAFGVGPLASLRRPTRSRCVPLTGVGPPSTCARRRVRDGAAAAGTGC